MQAISDPLRQYLTRFVDLTDPEWQALSALVTTKTVSRRTFLIQKGERATEIYFLLSGSCRVFYDKDGEEWTTYFCFENSLVAAELPDGAAEHAVHPGAGRL